MMDRAKILVVLSLSLLLAGFGAAQQTRAGGTVIVGNETGDLAVTGGTVLVEGPVDGDLTVFAGDLVIEDNVSGSVNAFAGNIRLSGRVGEDLNAAAGNLFIADEATVGRSLDVSAGSVFIGGTVDGNATVETGRLILGENAVINGDLAYSAENFTDRGATVAGETRLIEADRQFQGLEAMFAVANFIFRLLVAGVLLILFPGFAQRVSQNFSESSLRSGLYGLLVLIVVPVLFVAMAITIIGIPLAILTALFYLLGIWIATLYGSYALGDALIPRKGVNWIGLLAGLIIWEFLSIIPILGGLIQFVILVLGLGAMAMPGWTRIEERRS